MSFEPGFKSAGLAKLGNEQLEWMEKDVNGLSASTPIAPTMKRNRMREKDGKFKSAALDTDDTFSQTFATPGEYEYFCSIHPYMTGKIVVEPAGLR